MKRLPLQMYTKMINLQFDSMSLNYQLTKIGKPQMPQLEEGSSQPMQILTTKKQRYEAKYFPSCADLAGEDYLFLQNVDKLKWR